MDSAYHVLRALGVPNLSAPVLHCLPNGWSDKILGRHYSVNEVENIQIETAAIEPLKIPSGGTVNPCMVHS